MPCQVWWWKVEAIQEARNIKVKLSPKCNLGFFCECIWVKPSCKSIITTKEAILRLTVVSFLGKLIFNGVLGHSYTSINPWVSIPECDLTGRRVMVDHSSSRPVRSHSGISTFCLQWRRRSEDTAANVSSSKTCFLVNSPYTDNVLNACVHVLRPWWYYEQSFMLCRAFLVFWK